MTTSAHAFPGKPPGSTTPCTLTPIKLKYQDNMSTIQIAPAMSDVRVTGSRITARMHNGRRYVYQLPSGLTFPRSVTDRYEVRRNFRDALALCSYIDQAQDLMNGWLRVQGRLTIDDTRRTGVEDRA